MDVIQEEVTAGVGSEAVTEESTQSAVSWAAIIAGAIVAAATSLILLAVGSGLGLAAATGSPAAAVAKFSVATAIWLIVVQWVASAAGGYLTGRLRTKWAETHTHEVFFRDTAHGFVSWALSTVIVAAVFASAASSLLGNTVRAATTASAQGASSPSLYDVDLLFRSSSSGTDQETIAARDETMRILARGLSSGDVPAPDRDYVAKLIAARTGIPAVDARRHVDDTINRLKAGADSARKVAATTSLFTALSMLVGAFIACVAAALGGKRRDLHP
jgi:hypothetical protein